MSTPEADREAVGKSELLPTLVVGLQAVFMPRLDFEDSPGYLRGGEQTHLTPDQVTARLNTFLAEISKQGGQVVGQLEAEVQEVDRVEEVYSSYGEPVLRTVLIVNKPSANQV